MITREIDVADLETITSKVEKLRRRAVKLGLPAFGFEVPGTVTRRQYHYTRWFEPDTHRVEAEPLAGEALRDWQLRRVRSFTEVRIEAVEVKLAGWAFVGTLTWFETEDGKKEVLVSAVPGQEVPPDFRRSTPDRCDHCRATRYRTEAFVVRHESGEHKQVGRQCLAAFLGADPSQVMAASRLLGAMDEADFWSDGTSGGEPAWPLGPYLACVAASMKSDGWLSRGKARTEGGWATADRALDLLDPSDRKREPHQPTDDEVNLAQDALDWHAATWADLPEPNDYQHNLALALRLGVVVRKTMGIAASLISVYQRETEKGNRDRLEAERRERAPSDHVGLEGQRLDLDLDRLLGVRHIESQWGSSVLLSVTDPAGNVLKWFCSGDETPLVDALNEKARGERARVVVTATVKKHEEYRGEKQTVLTRVTVWSPQAIETAEKKAARLAAKRSA